MSSSSLAGPKPGTRAFWVGVFFALTGAVLFSAKAIVAKLMYQAGSDALTVIGLRMLLSLPVFAAIAVWQMWLVRQGRAPRLTPRERWQMVLLGLIGYYASSLLDFLGLQYISAGLERLILFLSPSFVLLITALYLKRPISSRQWLALAVSYLSVCLVFAHDLSFAGSHVLLGSVLVLGAALSYAIYLIGSGELVKRVGATRLVAYAMTVSALVTMVHWFVARGWQAWQQPALFYELSLVHAVFNTIVPTFMVMWAVSLLGPPLASLLGMIGPVSILFLAAWLLDEPVTGLQLVGTAGVLAGFALLRKPSGRRARRAQPAR